jgi:hypothetical protein
MEVAKLIVDKITITVELDEDGYYVLIDSDYAVPSVIRNGSRMMEV